MCDNCVKRLTDPNLLYGTQENAESWGRAILVADDTSLLEVMGHLSSEASRIAEESRTVSDVEVLRANLMVVERLRIFVDYCSEIVKLRKEEKLVQQATQN